MSMLFLLFVLSLLLFAFNLKKKERERERESSLKKEEGLMELLLFSFVSLFVGGQRKNNNKVSASSIHTNKRSPFFLHCT